MKKLFFIWILISLTACGGRTTNALQEDIIGDVVETITEENLVDTISDELKNLKAIENGGSLAHIDTYKIGNLKGIEVQAMKFTTDADSLVSIVLRKDCGGEYYYSWENAFINQKELPSIFKAITEIRDNLNRTTDHTEKYAYLTKDDVLISAENTGNGWKLNLSVDSRKNNAFITITPAELDKFVSLLQEANDKIEQIK